MIFVKHMKQLRGPSETSMRYRGKGMKRHTITVYSTQQQDATTMVIPTTIDNELFSVTDSTVIPKPGQK